MLFNLRGFWAQRLAWRTRYIERGYLYYPATLELERDSPETLLTYDEFFASMNAAGANFVRFCVSGGNTTYGGGACSFEPPPYGTYNIWHSVLDPADLDTYRADQVTYPISQDTLEQSNIYQLIQAAEANDVFLWICFFDYVEFEDYKWLYHAWRLNNRYTDNTPTELQDRGFIEDKRLIFTDPQAIQAAKDKVTFFINTFGASPAIACWEVMNELTWLGQRQWWGIDEWGDEIRDAIRTKMKPWLREIAAFIKDTDPRHRPVASSNPRAPPYFREWSDDPDEYYNVEAELHKVPEIDVIGGRGYRAGADPLAFINDLRKLQEKFWPKIVIMAEYYPFDDEDDPRVELPPFLGTKECTWITACGERYSIGALRMPGIEETQRNVWISGGYADPDLHEATAVTRNFLPNWDDWDLDACQAWDDQIVTDDALYTIGIGDGSHVNVLIRWNSGGDKLVTITGLTDGWYRLMTFNWITGEPGQPTIATVAENQAQITINADVENHIVPILLQIEEGEMTNYYVHHAPTYQALFENNVANVLTEIDANPAITRAQLVANLSLPDVLVATVLMILREQGLIQVGQAQDGTEHFWTAEDWATALKSNVIAARAWVLANDGSTTQQMATDLSLHFAIAVRLAHVLEREGLVKLTVTTVAL